MHKETLTEKYLRQAQNFSRMASREEKYLLVLSLLRLLIFAGGLILIWFAISRRLFAGYILILPLVLLFLFLLKRYSTHSDKKIFLQNLSLINRHEADAISGDLSAFESGSMYADPHHSFSNDVDLFGKNSLFRYLNRTITGYGRDILASWLTDPYSLSADLSSRQAAIREIAEKESWRHRFMAAGMMKPLEKSDIAGLVDWMNEDSAIRSRFLKNVLIYVLPGVTILSLLLVGTGVIYYAIFTFLFLLNLLFVVAGLRKVNKIHRGLTGMQNYLASIHQLLKAFEEESFESVIMADVKGNISGNSISATVSVQKLSELIQAFDSRLNLIAGFILNGLFLWDYQCIFRLDRWKTLYRQFFPVWLEMVGRTDAFVSLGNYAFNNPKFVFPEKSDNGSLFSISSMGHPLIEESRRVCNDFLIERSGNVCIISGANMSGKSTFLRTVAVNYILAMAGAPVCADSMIFTPLKLFTSMRTTDSLSENESYFYAELRRLKYLKEEIANGEPLLFILDEILKGTNSEDKSIGSMLFIRRIVEMGGTGLIATHDVSLGRMEKEFPGIVFNKCFEVEIEGETIIFDYKLQDGITRKMNAAILMKQMGILD